MARVQFVYDAGETPALHTQRVDKTTLTIYHSGIGDLRGHDRIVPFPCEDHSF